MGKKVPYSAPTPRSLPTINGPQSTQNSLATWNNTLANGVKNALPAPTPLNFNVVSARGGLQLNWSPVQDNSGLTGAPDGYEILKSESGTFTDDLQVIPVKGNQISSFFDSTGGVSKTVAYRIRTTSGTANNPQSQRGPESGVVSHTSIDSSDTTTQPSTRHDQFTTDQTRSNARLGNYGTITPSPLGATGGSSSGSGSGSGGGGTPIPTPSVTTTFDKIGTGENTTAAMTVGEGASISADLTAPGVIDATEINGVPITGDVSTAVGKVPISQGDGTAVWGDPTVQGVYADGTSVASPGSVGDLSTIQPVLVAGKDGSGNMASLPITANGMKTDGSAVTQPISAASLPLPTGAATETTLAAAKTDLDTLAGAVTSSKVQVNVSQVNGATPNLAQETGGNLATVASSAADPGAGTAPTKGLLRLSIANNTPPAATNGQSIAAQSDLQGNLRVNPYGGNGSFKSQLSKPTAGNNGTLTVPSGKKWVVKVITATLVTDSTVANRTMEIIVSDASGNVMAVKLIPFDQAGSLTGRYILAPSLTDASSLTANGNVNFGFPEMLLGSGWTIATSVSSLQSGDIVTLFANTLEIAD